MRSCRSITLAWCLLLVAAALPSHAVTKILVVPTARTMGARRYAIDLDRKEALFDGSTRQFTLSPKIGIGERVQLEAKIPLGGGSNGNVLFNGKYTFAVADNMKSAAALGFENLGTGSRTVPYIALSRLFPPVDLTIGAASGRGSLAIFFTGADYRPNDRLHILADYNTGPKTFASLGFQYDFSRQWSLKSGLEARRHERADVLIKVSYGGGY